MKEISEIKVKFDDAYYRELCKEKKIKNKDISELCGICRDGASRLKHGKRMPSIHLLYRISIVLDVPMEDLLKEC